VQKSEDMKIAVSLLLLLPCASAFLQPNSWRGITPAHSTCEDVKKILKVDTCSLPTSEYTIPDYRVSVSFANDECDKSPDAWRVPKGTVLSLVITPQHAMSVSQFGIDISQFKKRPGEEIIGMEQYDNDEEGVSVELFQGYVMNVFLRPRKTDDALRCKPIRERGAETVTDPTCCDPEAPNAIKQAWQKFTADGRYRLAVQSDMKEREPKARAFAYASSSLGYDKHEAGYHHLAVIVIDTHRSDFERFGLLIFSAPRTGNGNYKPYWVLRNRDLSHSYLDEYLGFLDLVTENQHGSESRCKIKWDVKNKRYVCR
jgi:hypothetical protein